MKSLMKYKCVVAFILAVVIGCAPSDTSKAAPEAHHIYIHYDNISISGNVPITTDVAGAAMVQVQGRKYPTFKLPTPVPSGRVSVPVNKFPAADKVMDVAMELDRALAELDYQTTYYLPVTESGEKLPGFVLATQLEQIHKDGTPLAGSSRFLRKRLNPQVMSIPDYIKSLFTAQPGYYRSLVFILTDYPIPVTEERITDEEISKIAGAGMLQLPSDVAETPLRANQVLHILIYEFQKNENSTKAVLNSPTLIGKDNHLKGTRLMSVLNLTI